MSTLPPIVLSFAATDPTGGAGTQADLMTLASMGCHPLSVVTAVTVQDTSGIEGIHPIDSDWVSDQARAVLEDMPVAAFKVGFVGSLDNIGAIAAIVADYPDIPLVLDPVMASGRGDEMAGDEMIAALRELLVPQTTVITPNSLEARRLALDDVDDVQERSLPDCARTILALGCEYVLITGTHEGTPNVINTLFGENGEVSADVWDRLPGSYHGSGCTLASAIAALLASGLEVREAVREAQEFTWHALAAGFRPGMGQHLPDRFFWARKLRESDDE
jgi:hydroxymethylpyrimidine/phosphomethylpyrimidine kinase